MSPFEAAHAARLLDVGHVVPMHYGTEPFPVPLSGTPEELREQLAGIHNKATVYAMKSGEDLASHQAS